MPLFTLTVKIPTDLLEELDLLVKSYNAAGHKVTRSDLVRRAIAEFVARHKIAPARVEVTRYRFVG